jgi:hypothetical protein
VVAVAKAGSEDGHHLTGGTLIVDPNGKIVAELPGALGQHHAGLGGDAAVMFGSAVAGEVEDRLLAEPGIAIATAACVGSMTGMPSSRSRPRRCTAMPAQPITVWAVMRP